MAVLLVALVAAVFVLPFLLAGIAAVSTRGDRTPTSRSRSGSPTSAGPRPTIRPSTSSMRTKNLGAGVDRPRQTITVLPIRQLTGHPANIRDDLGDFDDMAKSIREQASSNPSPSPSTPPSARPTSSSTATDASPAR